MPFFDAVQSELPDGAQQASPELQTRLEQRISQIDRLILGRAASDPGFKERLAEDEQAALAEAGLLEQVRALEGPGDDEVVGHTNCYSQWFYYCQYSSSGGHDYGHWAHNYCP